ncbi:hypothetical protein ACIBJD_39400 [Kitasatospora sp. NPDC050467]
MLQASVTLFSGLWTTPGLPVTWYDGSGVVQSVRVPRAAVGA